MNEITKRDFEWITALEKIIGHGGQIAFTGDPERFVDAIVAPLIERANREARLAVDLRNRAEDNGVYTSDLPRD